MGPFLIVQLNVFADGAPGMADRLVRFQVHLHVLDAVHTCSTNTLSRQLPLPSIGNPPVLHGVQK